MTILPQIQPGLLLWINPAKETDSRYKDYLQKYGESSWELDAIEPRELARLVTEAIKAKITDPQAWNETQDLQAAMTAQILTIAKQLG